MGAIEARAEIERFGNELRQTFRDLAEEQVYDTMRILVLDLFRELVQGSRELGASAVNGTPVDTGRARGNWQIGIGAVPADIIETDDKQGAATITRESAKVLADALRENPFQVVWITNNVPYIEILEGGRRRVTRRVETNLLFGGQDTMQVWAGSEQAPDGWIRLAVERTRRRLPARTGGAS